MELIQQKRQRVSDPESIEDQIERVRNHAHDAGAFVVSSPILSGSHSSDLRAFLDFPEFLGALTHVRPRLLYLDVTKFDAAEMAIERSKRILENDDYEDDHIFS